MRNPLGAKYGGGEGGRRADQGPREGGRERERKAQRAVASLGGGRAMAARPKEGREREKGWRVKCFLRGMHARSTDRESEDRGEGGRNHTPPRASNRVDDRRRRRCQLDRRATRRPEMKWVVSPFLGGIKPGIILMFLGKTIDIPHQD